MYICNRVPRVMSVCFYLPISFTYANQANHSLDPTTLPGLFWTIVWLCYNGTIHQYTPAIGKITTVLTLLIWSLDQAWVYFVIVNSLLSLLLTQSTVHFAVVPPF